VYEKGVAVATKKRKIPAQVLQLEHGIENRVLNAFKHARGRLLTRTYPGVIPILTESGWWMIARVNRPFWHNAEYLSFDALIKRQEVDPYDGLPVDIALNVAKSARSGTISLAYDRIRFDQSAKEYLATFEQD
jgi:hypothetical protein